MINKAIKKRFAKKIIKNISDDKIPREMNQLNELFNTLKNEAEMIKNEMEEVKKEIQKEKEILKNKKFV